MDRRLFNSAVGAQICRIQPGRACSFYPGFSDVSLIRYSEGIICLVGEVSDVAFDLGVAEQEPRGSTVDDYKLAP